MRKVCSKASHSSTPSELQALRKNEQKGEKNAEEPEPGFDDT